MTRIYTLGDVETCGEDASTGCKIPPILSLESLHCPWGMVGSKQKLDLFVPPSSFFLAPSPTPSLEGMRCLLLPGDPLLPLTLVSCPSSIELSL